MPKIGPAQSYEELEKSATQVSDGRARDKGLPGVKTDAKTVDVDAYLENGKLAAAIADAMESMKKSNKDGPLFVLSWRMYPNKENPHWKGKTHSCGCGCGCIGRRKPPPRRRRP
jgi:hypothetical protein